MNTPAIRSANDMTDEEFLDLLGRPAFLSVHQGHVPTIRAVVRDDQGVPWAFIDRAAFKPNFAFVFGGGAVLRTDGDGIEIAVRAEAANVGAAEWAKHAGDAEVLQKGEWQRRNQVLLPTEWEALLLTNQIGEIAVRLPFEPSHITLVDRQPQAGDVL